MAIVYNIVRKSPDQSKMVVDITLDGSYSAGGYALTPASLGLLAAPDMVDPILRSGQGLVPVWNQSTGKLMMYRTGAVVSTPLQEAVNTDITTAFIVRCEVTGIPLV